MYDFEGSTRPSRHSELIAVLTDHLKIGELEEDAYTFAGLDCATIFDSEGKVTALVEDQTAHCESIEEIPLTKEGPPGRHTWRHRRSCIAIGRCWELSCGV